MYKCLECGSVFETPKTCTENLAPYGEFNNSSFDHQYSACPHCDGEYEEAVQCEECEEYFFENDLVGNLCTTCLSERTEDIKVGMFIETLDKVFYNRSIRRIVDIDDDFIIYLDKSINDIEYVDIYDLQNWTKNPIDVVKLGDYVNGSRVLEIRQNEAVKGKELIVDSISVKYIYNDDIESIITKEEFEDGIYKLERIDK